MDKRAFSVIELIMVMVIAAIVAVVLVTDFSSSNANIKIQTAAFKLKSDIVYAQSLAVTQQLRHGVVFSPPNAYSVYKQTTSNIINDPLKLKAFTVNYDNEPTFKGISLSASFGSPNTNRVEFDNLGIPYSNATDILVNDGSITLSYYGINATVTVTKNTGRVSY